MLCSMYTFLAVVFLVFTVLFIVWLRWTRKTRIAIVVLGDIGVSPRMQYHALSFIKTGFGVDLIGYGGSTPHSRIVEEKNIRLVRMPQPPSFIQRLPRMAVYAVKALFQSGILAFTLLFLPKPKYMLVQNPPSIPSLPICWFVCRLRGSRFLIDWHNYGHTRMALTLKNKRHILVTTTKRIEGTFGKRSDGGFCVSKAMQSDLKNSFGVSATVHYDRPAEIFLRPDLVSQHILFVKLAQNYDLFKSKGNNGASKSAFTIQFHDGVIEKLDNRPALVVSSTSWSDDEDFSILIQAFDEYEEACHKSLGHLPNICGVITGKGPLKEHYMGILKEKKWKHIQVCTPWLEANDYPVMLGSADLGVCLHTSSSGIDLPMKVVDMFGVGLPVCALGYQALPELVHHNKNGLVFHCGHELAQQLQDVLKGFPQERTKLFNYRKTLEKFERWHDEWVTTVLPVCKSH